LEGGIEKKNKFNKKDKNKKTKERGPNWKT
jgi:hypothetical protein